MVDIAFYFGRIENYDDFEAVKNQARRIMCGTK